VGEATVHPEKPESVNARQCVLNPSVYEEFHGAQIVADERFDAILLPEEDRPNVDV